MRHWSPLKPSGMAIIAVAIGVLSSITTAQQTAGPFKDARELPDTPAGRRMRELIDVINAHDGAKTRELVANSFTPKFRDVVPMDEHVAVFDSVYQTTGGVEFYGIRRYTEPRPDSQLVAIVRTKLTDSWRGITLEVEPEPPHRIATLTFSPARPPSDLPDAGKKLSTTEVIEQLRPFMDRVAASDVFSGTVLLARNGEVLFKQAYGLASKEFDVPNRIDTKFNLGSMNKMFTAVAIAQLAERGKLSFDDPIGKHLSSDWLPAEITGKVTIQHLLTHTSGLGSYFNEKFMGSSRALYRKVEDYKPLIADEKLDFEPGTNWSYSNTGFLLLGAIIEKVAGQSYFDYVRENIFKPAGMTNTDSYEMDRPTPNLAIGYSRVTDAEGKHWENNLYKHVIKGGPAGGGFSTVEDLLKFDIAMRNDKLLSKAVRERLWTPAPASGSAGQGYGFGFGIRSGPAGRIVGHSGGFPGISADLAMYLDKGYTVAVLSNYDEGASVVEQKLTELLSRTE